LDLKPDRRIAVAAMAGGDGTVISARLADISPNPLPADSTYDPVRSDYTEITRFLSHEPSSASSKELAPLDLLPDWDAQQLRVMVPCV